MNYNHGRLSDGKDDYLTTSTARTMLWCPHLPQLSGCQSTSRVIRAPRSLVRPFIHDSLFYQSPFMRYSCRNVRNLKPWSPGIYKTSSISGLGWDLLHIITISDLLQFVWHDFKTHTMNCIMVYIINYWAFTKLDSRCASMFVIKNT